MLLSTPIRIEIQTQDLDLICAAREKFSNHSDLRIAERTFVCDSVDWETTAKKVATTVFYASSVVSLDLISAWLADRFIKNPPEQVTINNKLINYEQINVFVLQQIHVVQEHNDKNK